MTRQYQTLEFEQTFSVIFKHSGLLTILNGLMRMQKSLLDFLRIRTSKVRLFFNAKKQRRKLQVSKETYYKVLRLRSTSSVSSKKTFNSFKVHCCCVFLYILACAILDYLSPFICRDNELTKCKEFSLKALKTLHAKQRCQYHMILLKEGTRKCKQDAQQSRKSGGQFT